MERRTAAPRTLFEKKMANVITLIIVAVIAIIAVTFGVALFKIINRAEFGIGVKMAVWESLKPFAWILAAEIVLGIVIGRRVAVVTAKTLAGPIARITDCLKDVVDGGKTELLCVRKGDEPEDLIALINRLISKIAGR